MSERANGLEEAVSLALRLSPLDKVRLVERVMATLTADLSGPAPHVARSSPRADGDSEAASATGAADQATWPTRDSAPNSRSFWDPTPDLETLAREQSVHPVENPDDLVGDFWPEDESVDDFIAAVRAWRREGG